MKQNVYISKRKVEPTPCPVCHVQLDGISRVKPDSPAEGDECLPSPGSVTICIYCGSILIYEPGNHWRETTREDIKQIAATDPKCARMLGIMVHHVRELIEQKRKRKYGQN
jgi:hypothetical protein